MKPINKQIEDYLDFCQFDRNMTRQTLDSKRAVLTQFARQIEATDMQDFTMDDFKAWRRQITATGKVSARTVNTRTTHLISMCKWLRDEGYSIRLNLNRIHKLEEEPPRRNFFTRNQIEQVKELASPFAWILISLAFDSGLRISELQQLRLENLTGREMRIVGKGRKPGQLFMSQETRDKLDEWIEEMDITDYLWPSPVRDDGLPYSLDELRYHMRKPFKKAGLKGFYPHSLRHSFGTDLQTNGAPIHVTQKLMRHSKIATTEGYLHGLSNERLGALYDKYSGSSSSVSIEDVLNTAQDSDNKTREAAVAALARELLYLR